MSTTTTSTVHPTNVRTLQDSHMTATVTTESGARYTVVARPKVGVVLINDTKGWALKGARIRVIEGRMYLLKADGSTAAATTALKHIYILSN